MLVTFFRVIIAPLLLIVTSTALAGPPLTIDDPGVLEPGGWEIITSGTLSSAHSGKTYTAPQLDVSLGVLADLVQISASSAWVSAHPDDRNSESDLGNTSLGIKWRFWNSEQLKVAFSPVYAFSVSAAKADLGIGHETDIIALPIVAEYRINNSWRLNTSATYAHLEDEQDRLGYGAALAHDVSDRWTLLFELSGSGDTNLKDDLLTALAGFDYGIRQNLHILFSAATGLRESNDDELDYQLYFGLQFFY